MPVHNADIGSIFEDMADLLEIQSSYRFRVRAYAMRPGQWVNIAATSGADRPGRGADLEGGRWA